MKVTYIHQHFRLPTEAGGTRSWEFARRLAADGHQVTMICGGDTRRTYATDGFQVIQLVAGYSNSMSTWWRLRSFFQFMARATLAAVRSKCDVVVATSTPLTVAIPAAIAALVRRSRIVLEIRDLWPEVPIALGALPGAPLRWSASLLEAFAYATANEIIALSPGMADGVRKRRPQARVTVVPNACDFDLFNLSDATRREFRTKEGWKHDEAVVLYAGSLGRIYDTQWIVHTAAQLSNESFRFIILGDGSEACVGRTLARRLGLDADRLFLGPVSKQEVANFVAASDMIVSTVIDEPTLKHASINKIFDGLAASRPIVANHDGWLSEAVVKNGAGWIFDRDPAVAAEQFRAVLRSDEGLRSAARSAFEWGAANFHRDDLYRAFRDVVLASPTSD